MNLTYLHILFTHLPIMGSILGAIVLLYGIGKQITHTISAAYILFLFSAAGGAIAYFTGESAEETVENLPGIIEASIKTHEEFAEYTSVALLFLGLASIVGLYLTTKKFVSAGKFAYFVLVISLLTFILCARTGYLGGNIRHTELHVGVVSSPVPHYYRIKMDR